jgi:dTDP-4-dehydrorhamnose 3,5-epimerase
MTIQARKDPQSVTRNWQPVSIPIEGVRLIRSRHVVTRNGYTTENFRSDWDGINYDAKHVMTNRWDTPITTDWHCHHKQSDHIMVLLGRILIGLYDDREKSVSRGKSMVVRCDWADPQLVVVPPGVYHSFKVLVAPALMLNTITHVYEYEDPDHWRLAGGDKAQIPLDLSKME